MKKFTLAAAAALTAVAAQAQYNVDPTIENVIKGGVATVDCIFLPEGGVADFEKAGATVNNLGPDDVTRHLYVWDGTFNAYTTNTPPVDFYEGGYVALEVASAGWSGAGVTIDEPGVNLSHMDDNTIFHMAYMTPSKNAPASVAIILLDGKVNINGTPVANKPAKIALGEPYVDGGSTYPTIGAVATDEWQGIEISLGALKKFWPDFDFNSLSSRDGWYGNIFSFLAGGVAGKTIAFDAVYFYNREGKGDAGVDAVEGESADFVVTANTVNVMGANGIQLYNLAGQLVKATEGTTLGLDNLAAGVYVAKAANKTRKIIVK